MDKEKRFWTREKIETIYHLALTFSVLIALVTFLVQVYVRNEEVKANELLRWKMEAVYSIIKNHEYIGFDAIKSEYLKLAQQEKEIPIEKKDIQNKTLERVLYYLTHNRMIEIRRDKTYVACFSASDIVDSVRDSQKTYKEYRWIDQTVTNLLATESGKYSIDQMCKLLREKNPEISDRSCQYCILGLIADGFLDLKNEKLYIHSGVK